MSIFRTHGADRFAWKKRRGGKIPLAVARPGLMPLRLAPDSMLYISTIEIRAASAVNKSHFSARIRFCARGQPAFLLPAVPLVPSPLPARSKSFATETCNARASFSTL